MCFSTILSRVLHKYFVYIPPTPLSNGPSVNKVLSCLVITMMIRIMKIILMMNTGPDPDQNPREGWGQYFLFINIFVTIFWRIFFLIKKIKSENLRGVVVPLRFSDFCFFYLKTVYSRK